jgi:hypothetical protein
MALYLASEEDRETTDCFLLFHEIKEEPRRKTKPETDLRESLHAAQSESVYTVSLKSEDAEKKIP